MHLLTLILPGMITALSAVSGVEINSYSVNLILLSTLVLSFDTV